MSKILPSAHLVHASEARPEAPRLLLLSYHFPPGRTAGALRWEKFSGYAAERGWGIDVVAVEPAALERADISRLERLPAGVRLFGVPVRPLRRVHIENAVARRVREIQRALRKAEPTEGGSAPSAGVTSSTTRLESIPPEQIRWSMRKRDVLRAYWAWTDFAKSKSWADDARAVARSLIEPGVHRAVITCGPPHMVHDAGRAISEEFGIPLVMDLRDPWAIRRRLPEATASPMWFYLASRYERRAVARAALVVANTEPVRESMEQTYEGSGARFLTITNGYDEEALPKRAPAQRFNVTYAGGIYLDRDPRNFLRAAGRAIRELNVRPDQFRIDFIGKVDEYEGHSVKTLGEGEGVGDFLHLHKPVPREELFAILAQSSILLSLPQDSPWAIPSKLFEYMQFDSWMLVLADRGTPTETLLRGSKADVVAPDDVDGLASVLVRRYRQFSEGERPERVGRDKRYSRRFQAGMLFDAIDAVIGRQPPDENASSLPADGSPKAGLSQTNPAHT